MFAKGEFYMNLQKLKDVAAQFLALSAELLRLVDVDESERDALVESAKKTPAET